VLGSSDQVGNFYRVITVFQIFIRCQYDCLIFFWKMVGGSHCWGFRSLASHFSLIPVHSYFIAAAAIIAADAKSCQLLAR
jgi:hypothetical protein